MTELVCVGAFLFKKSIADKKMNQLEIEQNLNYDFSLTGDDEKALEPVLGPARTGLANFGNRQIDKSFS